jgi:plasmid stabilization system protein ParE
MKYNLTLTEKAESDFASIINYTSEQWGDEQAQLYSDLLDDALQKLEDDPKKAINIVSFPAYIVPIVLRNTILSTA